MGIPKYADLSKDQENQRYSKLKKSLPKLATASLTIALAVYFSYSSSPWRYVPIVVFASATVLLIASAIMERSVKTEKFPILITTDFINEHNESMHRIMYEHIAESFERNRVMREMCEGNRDFFREYNLREQNFIPRIEQILVRNIREPDFVSRIDGQTQMIHETELHRLASRKPMSDHDITQMKKILSNNMWTKYTVDHNWNTPLHNAMRSENLPAIKLLLEYGANCFIQNKNGKTPHELFSNSSHLVQQSCPFIKEKIREQQYSNNINKLLNIPQIKSKLCKNEKPYRKVPNCEGACSTLQELSVNKVLDSCCLGG